MRPKFLFPVCVLAAAIGLSILDGCKKETNPETPPEQTVEHPPATTVTIFLTQLDSAGNATSVKDSCTVRDTTLSTVKVALEGSLDLLAGKSYSGTFRLLDESKTPAEDLHTDIYNERDAHVFKFKYTGSTGDTTRVIVSDRDLDSKGIPFGFNFKANVTAGGSASGNLHVILEHHDDGDKSGKEFDLDLDRDFPVTIR